ncbi:histidine phosphatase family protein [Alteromonas halophila]|uniref:Phosphoglycerate mutase n=1 Tax=Alteromonas halophila TaxID=516698 RepID=A0A918JM91_9ALTE|nr:histidine phosphatase family protein [Alteromonas halophila]GGW89606.1 phosphoglycerate mutase [Alteromonas halophila]
MTTLYLVRHGQASFGKANYDKLSELGGVQSAYLGQYFAERGLKMDRLITGTLLRHRETAEGIGSRLSNLPAAERLPQLNEFDFMAVVNAYVNANPDAAPGSNATAKDYYRLLKRGMLAWASNELVLNDTNESWAAFETRVGEALHAISHSGAQHVLVVTSGGVIAMLLKHILGYPAESVVNINLQIRNASVSECLVTKSGHYLSSFNNIAHFEHPDRQHAITYS